MHTPDCYSMIQNQLNQLEEIISSTLFNREDPHHLLLFIKRTLRQFNLTTYHETEILTECYIRTRKKIEAGVEIERFIPWMKKVLYNIIREKSKYIDRQECIQKTLVRNGYVDLEIEHDNLDMESSDYRNLQSLSKSTDLLNPEDLEILILHIVDGLSWNQICELVNTRNALAKKISVSTLRKRGERALKRLRHFFFSYHLSGGGDGA